MGGGRSDGGRDLAAQVPRDSCFISYIYILILLLQKKNPPLIIMEYSTVLWASSFIDDTELIVW